MTENSEEPLLPPRRSIDWIDGSIRFIDQRLLPEKVRIIETDDWRVVARAIKGLGIRGAPLIGVTAALAVAATALKYSGSLKKILLAIDGLHQTRPTAVNLFWALDRMRDIALSTLPSDFQGNIKTVSSPLGLRGGIKGGAHLTQTLLNEALFILEDDRRRCRNIGKNAQSLISDGVGILTICNTGFLATAGEGTALAAIYRAHEDKKNIHVYVCETRPLLQGARLTAWELQNDGIPFTLIVDSAAAGLVASGAVDLCIIGADRIAVNGDTANKIGSYQLALACREHRAPFYVAAPTSTIDRECPDGGRIPVEERSSVEVSCVRGRKITPDGIQIRNPAFDIVPSKLIDGIITENGVERQPFDF